MMSIETIRAMSRDAAVTAAREGKEPYVPFDADEVEHWLDRGAMPIPFIGSYEPKGWRKVDEWFCDASGFGAPDEPAMTISAFLERVKRNIAEGHEYGYATTEAGQFQVYVGVFERKAKRARRRAC